MQKLGPGYLITTKTIEDTFFSGREVVGSGTYDAPNDLYFNALFLGSSDGEAMSPEQVTEQLAKLELVHLPALKLLAIGEAVLDQLAKYPSLAEALGRLNASERGTLSNDLATCIRETAKTWVDNV